MKPIINYIDLGVYEGREIDLLLTQYKPYQSTYDLYIYGIEANTNLYNQLILKYSNNDSIHIYNYAISDKNNDKINLYLSNNNYLGSSIFPTKNNVNKETYLTVSSITLSKFLETYVINFNNSINILKLNIEGAELYVYRDLISTKLLKKFNLFCGHPAHDIEKVSELSIYRPEYYKLISDNNIQLQYFCADFPNNCINIFNYINDRIYKIYINS